MLKNVLNKMKKIPRGWWQLALVILLGPLLLEVTGLFAYGKWRYEMTVVVETPEGIKEGSAVRQVSNTDLGFGGGFPESGNPANFKGEAAVVDLGKYGILFAVLGDSPYREFYNAYPNPYGAATVHGIAYYNRMLWGRKKVTLKPESYPQMVMFKDLNDPKSVTLAKGGRFKKEAQKYLPEDNLEELFGQGVKIKEVSVERTREPVTWKIQEVLPWFKALRESKARLNGSTSVAIFTNELSDNLGTGAFSVGRKQ